MFDEFTEEEREQMLDQAFKQMKIKRIHPSKEELEKEIINYLSKKKPCSLATCGKDGVPRISVVDYMNDGLVIYIISEGGQKFLNIKENNKVAIGMGTGSKAIATRGVNIWGIADVFTQDAPEFAHGMKVFSSILEEMQKAIGDTPIVLPKHIRLIRVTPKKMVYCHNHKGISNAHWTAQ